MQLAIAAGATDENRAGGWERRQGVEAGGRGRQLRRPSPSQGCDSFGIFRSRAWGRSSHKTECKSRVGVSLGPAPPEATSLEGSRRDDGASLSPPPPPRATTATVTKWQLGARQASHPHSAGDRCPCTPRMAGTLGLGLQPA